MPKLAAREHVPPETARQILFLFCKKPPAAFFRIDWFVKFTLMPARSLYLSVSDTCMNPYRSGRFLPAWNDPVNLDTLSA